MKKGEHALLVCKPDYAYGTSGSGSSIPPNATLTFDVELLDFEEKLDVENMTIKQRISTATEYKDIGNASFKAGNYASAISMYEKAVACVQWAKKAIIDDNDYETLEPPTKEDNDQAFSLLQSLRTNKAACFLKMGEYSTAIKEVTKKCFSYMQCSLVLKEDPRNIKALYRRACGQSHFGLLFDAKKDLELLLELDATNKAAQSELERVKKLIAADDKKTKKSLHSLFSKGGLYSEKPSVIIDFEKDDPTVFFDIKQGEKELGRIEMRLYSHLVGGLTDVLIVVT